MGSAPDCGLIGLQGKFTVTFVFHHRYVVIGPTGVEEWQTGGNRKLSLTVRDGASLTVVDKWDAPDQVISVEEPKNGVWGLMKVLVGLLRKKPFRELSRLGGPRRCQFSPCHPTSPSKVAREPSEQEQAYSPEETGTFTETGQLSATDQWQVDEEGAQGTPGGENKCKFGEAFTKLIVCMETYLPKFMRNLYIHVSLCRAEKGPSNHWKEA